MQINNNMNSSPNFGMSMRIMPRAKKALIEMTEVERKPYVKCSNYLKNTEYANLIMYDRNNFGIEYRSPLKGPVEFYGNVEYDYPLYSPELRFKFKDVLGNLVGEGRIQKETPGKAQLLCDELESPHISKLCEMRRLTEELEEQAIREQKSIKDVNKDFDCFG